MTIIQRDPKTKERTDLHCPAKFVPTNYTVQGLYDTGVDWMGEPIDDFRDWPDDADMGLLTRFRYSERVFDCHHCGHSDIRYIALVQHIPTGDYIIMGKDCVDRVGMAFDAYRWKAIQDRAKVEAVKAARQRKINKFAEAEPEIFAYLSDRHVKNDGTPAKVYSNNFVRSIAAQLFSKGELTEAQVTAVKANITREAEKATEREQAVAKGEPKPERVVPTTPVPEGRVTVWGTIVSTKEVEDKFSPYPDATITKMLFVMDDGNKVWCTLPQSLWFDGEGRAREQRGVRIQLAVTIERSKTDEHFGYGKRPVVKAEAKTESPINDHEADHKAGRVMDDRVCDGLGCPKAHAS